MRPRPFGFNTNGVASLSPAVARHELPWVKSRRRLIKPERAAAAYHKSSGIGHATKSKIELGVGGKDGFFDDIKVWNAEAAKL